MEINPSSIISRRGRNKYAVWEVAKKDLGFSYIGPKINDVVTTNLNGVESVGLDGISRDSPKPRGQGEVSRNQANQVLGRSIGQAHEHGSQNEHLEFVS